MKWVLISLGALVALIGLIALIGALLPKSHTASRTAKFNADAERVWQIITDFASMPAWRPELKDVKRLADRNGNQVWVETNKMGEMPYEVIELVPPSKMVTKIADDKLPFDGSWTYQINPLDSGCTVTITENGEVYNPIFRFMARFVFGHHATMETYLKNLGKNFGEEVTFIGSE